MNTFRLKISAPDGDIFNDEIHMISLRGIEGEFAVMAGHVPFVTAVKPCEIKIDLSDESVKTGECDGGLLSVSASAAVFLAGSVAWD